MEILNVSTESRNYPIYLSDSFDSLRTALETAGFGGGKAVIVSDSNVSALYSETIKNSLDGLFCSIGECVFEAGEANKTLDTVKFFYDKFIQFGLDRKSVVIALGGGVTGDLSGFASATYMRGISFIQIPTSLLAMVDSSVGGKTGADFAGLKNIIGAFYQPSLVYINVSVLKTLPAEQFASGMGEVIKHGIIRKKNRSYFDFIAANKELIKSLDGQTLVSLIKGSLKIKAKIVLKDEKESGLRELLNFGHTFGHAIEAFFEYEIPHGHCVAIGMAAAFNFAVDKGMFSAEETKECISLMTYFALPTSFRARYKRNVSEKLLELMLSDKKTKNGSVTLILPERIGRAVRFGDALPEDIIKALNSVKQSATST